MPESNPTLLISPIKNQLHSDQVDYQMVENQLEQDQSRAKWTTLYTNVFVDLLIEQIRQGNRPSNVFTRKAWKYVREEFNKQTGLTFDRQQLKNHLDVLRKRYNHVKALLEQPGFCWDATQSTVVATDDVWQQYIEVHPDAETVRKKGCPTYELLCAIFSDSGTLDEKCVVPKSGTIMQQMAEDQFRAKWTTPLEKIFADLLLEQVMQGNRSNKAFNKKAWKHISDEFNKKSGLNFDKQQLKNHHGVLKRLHGSVKSLLDHNGFSWDKSKYVILAENDVWAKYVQDHPDAEAIRVKGCPIYEQLDMIFSKPGIEQENVITDLATITPKMDSSLSQEESKQEPSRARWTVSLDMAFIDLLVEQTQQNSISNKKAWKRIKAEFSKRTGLKFDEQQLRNHQTVLRRLYNNIKSLIDQNGFSWNDSQNMVMADDEVWKNYIKVHPEAETIRGKEYPIFKHLCKMFSEPQPEGKYVHSSHEVELDQEGVTAETPEPVTDEASSQSTKKIDIQSCGKKHELGTPLYSEHHKRIRTETSHSPGEAVMERVSMANKRAFLAECSNQFSISSCIKLLNDMQEVDQDIYLAALDMFQDPDRRETFISMKSDMRLAWLKAKCNSMS